MKSASWPSPNFNRLSRFRGHRFLSRTNQGRVKLFFLLWSFFRSFCGQYFNELIAVMTCQSKSIKFSVPPLAQTTGYRSPAPFPLRAPPALVWFGLFPSSLIIVVGEGIRELRPRFPTCLFGLCCSYPAVFPQSLLSPSLANRLARVHNFDFSFQRSHNERRIFDSTFLSFSFFPRTVSNN